MQANGAVVLDFVERIERLASAHGVWDAFLAFAATYGMQFGALCDLPAADEEFRDTMICLSWPDGWSERYFEQDYVRRDPAVLQLSQTPDPYTWFELFDNPRYSRSQRRIVQEARDFKMTSGFVVPILGLRTGTAIVTIGGINRKLTMRDRAELQLAAIYTHARVRALTPEKRRHVSLPALSARERECLAWAAVGKSDSEIGDILSIAERTAHAHIENAKLKYGVATRMQAVVLAFRTGAISA